MTDEEDITLLLASSTKAVRDDPDEAKARFRASAAGHCPHCGVKHRTKTPDQCLDTRMSEKTLQNRVVDRAKRRGWKIAHAGVAMAAFDSQGNPVFLTPMSAGWPDLFMLNPKRPPYRLAMELKREDGVLTDEQVEWLGLMNECGMPAIVVRPSDLREGRVNAILDGRG